MARQLRLYQQDLKLRIYDEWKVHQNVLLVKPTGMGKTTLFCSIAHDLALHPQGPREPTVIMVHRKELIQQISLTLAEESIVHNIITPRPVIKGIVAAQRQMFQRQFYHYDSPVTVVSVDTLIHRKEIHAKWAQKIKRWITDEAAHVLRENKWGEAIALFPNAKGLGVTATPERLDRRGLGRHADGVFDVMVEGPNTRWGIEHGFLSRYKIAVPEGDFQRYLKKASGNSDYSKEAMAVASSQSHIVGDVVKNYQRFANGKQAILFATDIDTGGKMEKKFLEHGITAKLLTSKTQDTERLKALIDFREKRIKVLLNVDLFDEGLDVPGIECVIMARPTMSLGKYLQMIGRGLRPAPGKEFLIVIDHVGNVKEHGLPDSPREWTLDRIVRRHTVSIVRICSNYECNAPYDRALTACPYCGQEPVYGGGGGGGGKLKLEEVDGDLALLDPETLRAMYEGIQLEDPASVAQRVSRAAGHNAAIAQMRAQQERIETQKKLVDVIAQWAGIQKRHGYSDRSIHKIFYLQYDKSIIYALSEPRAAMQDMIDTLEMEISRWQPR